jgi:hypothetical protein
MTADRAFDPLFIERTSTLGDRLIERLASRAGVASTLE